MANSELDTRIRILVVDDHPSVRRGLVAMLRAEDDFALVGEAANGQEAETQCLANQPDVVLMDLKMPGQDGAEATRQVLKICPAARVLILTSFNEPDLVQRALASGAIGYLLKTADVDEIAQAIRRAHAGLRTYASEITDTLLSTIHSPLHGPDELTEREREILGLLVQGLSNQAIATRLFLSIATVKFHVSNVLSKLGVNSRLEAVIAARKLGM